MRQNKKLLLRNTAMLKKIAGRILHIIWKEVTE